MRRLTLAVGIKNKAARLEPYARIVDDVESERQFAEIKLREPEKRFGGEARPFFKIKNLHSEGSEHACADDGAHFRLLSYSPDESGVFSMNAKARDDLRAEMIAFACQVDDTINDDYDAFVAAITAFQRIL